jgi:prepilin-type N-terminal cleavage/methylation domain-containing protein
MNKRQKFFLEVEFMRKTLRNKKGFTLVELMVVVAILGILVAVAVPIFSTATQNAQKNTIAANLRTIDSAIMQYSAQTGATATSVTKANVENTYIEWPVGPEGTTYDIVDGNPEATITSATGCGSFDKDDKVVLVAGVATKKGTTP